MADKTTKASKNATEVKTVAQLQEELTKLQLEHLESRKSHKQGELVNPHVLTVQRKAIARIHGAITATTLSDLKEGK